MGCVPGVAPAQDADLAPLPSAGCCALSSLCLPSLTLQEA